jgi:hypothetical protein
MLSHRQKSPRVTLLKNLVQEVRLHGSDVLNQSLNRLACTKEAQVGKRVRVLHLGGKPPSFIEQIHDCKIASKVRKLALALLNLMATAQKNLVGSGPHHPHQALPLALPMK